MVTERFLFWQLQKLKGRGLRLQVPSVIARTVIASVPVPTCRGVPLALDGPGVIEGTGVPFSTTARGQRATVAG